MHNRRREDFLQAQRRARARKLIVDHYIAERVSARPQEQSGEEVGAVVHVLPSIRKSPAELSYAVVGG